METYKEEDNSLDQVKKYRQLTRLKLIQGMSPQELKKEFGEGAVLMQPGRAMVAEAEEPFLFVPLFMFTEWCHWSDRDDDSTRAILDRTFDKESPLAKRSRDKDARFEKYSVGDTEYKSRYVEHLCFPGLIYGDHQHSMTPVTLSFEKGEFVQGNAFCSAIVMRRAPLYLNVFKLQSAVHTNGKNEWFGFDFSNPATGPFVSEEEAPAFKALNAEYIQQHADRTLEVDRSDADEEVVDDISNPDGM